MKPFIHQFFTVLLILSITVTIIIYYAVKIEPYTVTINTSGSFVNCIILAGNCN